MNAATEAARDARDTALAASTQAMLAQAAHKQNSQVTAPQIQSTPVITQPIWETPAHTEIDLATVTFEELGLNEFDPDNSLVMAIYKARDAADDRAQNVEQLQSETPQLEGQSVRASIDGPTIESVAPAEAVAEPVVEETAEDREDAAILMAHDAGMKLAEALYQNDKLWLENYCLRVNKKMPTAPDEIHKYALMYQAVEKQEAEDNAEPEENLDESQEEIFPECPILPGALTDLAVALFPSLPIEFKIWGLITRWGLVRSGLDMLENEPHIQPRFYTTFVSLPNFGKTACINVSRDAMKLILEMVQAEHNKHNASKPHVKVFAEIENLSSADSGPFLVQEFFDRAKESNKQFLASECIEDRAKILLDPDELSDVFEKARTSAGRVSTLFIEMLKLHSSNRTGSGTKQSGNRPVENAHFAILAGTTIKKYPMLWTGTGGGADGLVSRFTTITTNAKPVPPAPLGTTASAGKAYERLIKLAQLPGQHIKFSEDAAFRLSTWWSSIDHGKESTFRILEAVKQLLIVLAVVNAPTDHTGTELTVSEELMEQAIKFGDYEIAIRERLNPGDAYSLVQAHEQAIIKWAQKHTTKRRPKSRNEFRRGINAHRLPGGLGTFLLAWKYCVGSDVLKFRDKTGKCDRYSL
jgi:hypothetical protein